MESAIRWNKFSKDVEKVLRQCVSSAMCNVKQEIMKGKTDFFGDFVTLYYWCTHTMYYACV